MGDQVGRENGGMSVGGRQVETSDCAWLTGGHYSLFSLGTKLPSFGQKQKLDQTTTKRK